MVSLLAWVRRPQRNVMTGLRWTPVLSNISSHTSNFCFPLLYTDWIDSGATSTHLCSEVSWMTRRLIPWFSEFFDSAYWNFHSTLFNVCVVQYCLVSEAPQQRSPGTLLHSFLACCCVLLLLYLDQSARCSMSLKATRYLLKISVKHPTLLQHVFPSKKVHKFYQVYSYTPHTLQQRTQDEPEGIKAQASIVSQSASATSTSRYFRRYTTQPLSINASGQRCPSCRGSPQ